jgi:hypothetical protein
MWALLRRVHTLGVISDWQYRTLAIEMSSLGWRTSEPGALEAETPTRVTSLVTWHLEQGREVNDLARAACLHPDEFARLYLNCPPPPGPAPLVAPSPRPIREATT